MSRVKQYLLQRLNTLKPFSLLPTLRLVETQTALQTYSVDPSHSQVAFKVRHLGFSKVRGRFHTFEGTVRMAPGQLDTLEAEATVQVATIGTGDEKRDGHLRSGDFFAAEEFPTMTFKSDGVSEVSGNRAKLAGELTIHGTTKRVVLDVAYLGEATDPWGGSRIALEATGTIDRTEFGLTWNQALEMGGLLVGNEVELELEIEAVQQDAP